MADEGLLELGDKAFGLIRTANGLGLILPPLQLSTPAAGHWRFDCPALAARFELEAAAITAELGTPDLRVCAAHGSADVEVGFTGAPAEVIAVTIIALFQAVREGNLPPA